MSDDCLLHVYKYEKELEKVTSFKAHDSFDFAWCSLDVHPTQPYVLSACHMQVKLWGGTRTGIAYRHLKNTHMIFVN